MPALSRYFVRARRPTQLGPEQVAALVADVEMVPGSMLASADRALRECADSGGCVTLIEFVRVAVEHLSPLRPFVAAAKQAGSLLPPTTATRGAAELLIAFRAELGE